MRIRQLTLLLIALICLSGKGFSQKTSVYDEPRMRFETAKDLFDKQKYGAARTLFLDVYESESGIGQELKGSALFYAGASAAALFHPDAGLLLRSFVEAYPVHPAQLQARFLIGNLSYRNRDHKEALAWYRSIDGNRLSREERYEYFFKRGYSHMMLEEYPSARQFLGMVRDPRSAFSGPATYYFGHVAYMESDYQIALEHFMRLRNDNQFGPVIPYYITHIYYLQKRYGEVIAYAEPLLNQSSTRRIPEIARLIGDAHTQQGDYREAIPFLEMYMTQASGRPSREDHYLMGMAYFHTGNHAQAVSHLEKSTEGEDTLAQNAWYHLAAAYLETNQKRFARNAFQQAYQLGHNDFIARESLFHYAKLSFELSLDPYNEAILSFQKYLTEYPGAEREQEANAHLADLFLTTRNYRDALASLEKINLNSPRLREAYQRVAYYRGVELFNNGAYAEAAEHFRKSQRFNENRGVFALALFWEGDALFRMGQFAQAVTVLDRFLISPGAINQPVYNRANYALGYAHFKLKNYPASITAFRKFTSQAGEDRKLLNDAHLRIADGYYVTRNFQAALDFYDRAIRIGVIDNDYAALQKALIFGALGQFDNKTAALEQFLRTHSNSRYAADARYELGNTWLVLNNSQNALTMFNQLINQHPNSSHVRSAMLKTGLIYFNNNDDERALTVFRQVIDKYPGSQQSQEALIAMRNIYVGLDRVDEYMALTRNLGFANVSTAQQDSLTYKAAENRYMQGDCANASRSFSNYLQQFPNGIFSINAHFYLAECDFRRNAHEEALRGYRYVISKPRSMFTENALSRAAHIEFRRNNHQEAYALYTRLEETAEIRENLAEARTGQMRSLFRMQRYQDAIAAARRLLTTDRITPDLNQEAQLIIGRSSIQINDLQAASLALERVTSIADNESTAEALYLLALIDYKKGNYESSEKRIFDSVNRLMAYDYWLAKAFLLLADNYLQAGNTFQARNTLQSILDNYEGEDLRSEARQKLQLINEKEGNL